MPPSERLAVAMVVPAAMVWKPKVMPTVPEMVTLATQPPPPSGGSVAVGSEHSNKCRRRWPRKRRASACERQEFPAGPALETSDSWGPPPPLDIPRPRRVIDHSAKIARAEQELCKALSVSIIGSTVAPPVEVLVAELARRYELLWSHWNFIGFLPGTTSLSFPTKLRW
jgi:hypothetical protein